MRSLFFLAALCCLVLSAFGNPISRPEDDKEVGRQAVAPAAAAPAASADDDDDEDDDDDDEDDVGLDLAEDEDDEDDDEDDEEEADDEDDDYLERIFDEILGGDEDDDDEPAVAAVQPVAAPVDTAAAAPAAAVAEEAAAASEDVEASETETVAEGEENEVQKDPISAETEAVAASSEAAAATEAEDDDDDDDDIDDALEPEDDDEEDEEEDDDEEDDVTDAFGRNVSAKHSRALSDEPNKDPVAESAAHNDIFKRYNRFVDNILQKMNDILRKSYDPVNVKLQPIDASKKNNKPKKNKPKSNKRKTNKKNTARRNLTKKNKVKSTEIPESIKEEIVENSDVKPIENVIEEITNATSESRAIKDTKAKPTTIKAKPPTKATKPKPKPPTKATTKKPVTTKNKTKTSEKSRPRAKGTLYGLSSLRRKGDVTVKIEADHTTVKSNFAVGPLVLRVEKEVGRGAKKELKSATATTEEMIGKLSFRVSSQGVATLHSIKVLQPKQVRVVSNHERTRELVWQRSSRIAHVVSEKLLSASRPMFNQHTVVKQ